MKASRPTQQKSPSPSPQSGKNELLGPRAFLLAVLGSIAAVFAVYRPSLGFQFILDDHRFTKDPRIQFSGYVWDYFANYVWAQVTGAPPSFYRPMFVLWMRINFILCGLSPWGWHFLSISKHVLVAILLGVLVWKLLRNRAAALLASALFALHPAQVESVAWVTVPDPIMAAAVLVSLLLYLEYSEAGSKQLSSDNRKAHKSSQSKAASAERARWLIASSVAALGALLAKETAVILPLLIFAIAFFTPSDGLGSSNLTPVRHEKVAADFKARLTRAVLTATPFLFVTALYFLLRLNALGGKLTSRTQQLPLRTVILSWPATLCFYLKVLFWPVRSRAFADPILADHFSFREVGIRAAILSCILAGLAALLRWVWRRSQLNLLPNRTRGARKAIIIGTALLVLPILLTLNLNALNPGDFLHGRYTYLPIAGLMLLAATTWHLSGKMRNPLLVLAVIFVAVFGALTLKQEKEWSDDLTLFTRAHELAPHNAPVARNLADAHVQQALQLGEDGRCDEAIPVFQQVSHEYPDDWYAWAALGDCQVQLNRYPQAEESFHRAADLSHDPKVIEQWQFLREHMGLPNSAPAAK